MRHPGLACLACVLGLARQVAVLAVSAIMHVFHFLAGCMVGGHGRCADSQSAPPPGNPPQSPAQSLNSQWVPGTRPGLPATASQSGVNPQVVKDSSAGDADSPPHWAPMSSSEASAGLLEVVLYGQDGETERLPLHMLCRCTCISHCKCA